MNSDYNNDFEYQPQPKKKNSSTTIVLLVIGLFFVCSCCCPIISMAAQVLLSMRGEADREIAEYDTPVNAMVVDIKTETNERHPDRIKYTFTYEYEYNGTKYRSDFQRKMKKRYRNEGDQVEIKINPNSPEDFYDPIFLDDILKQEHLLAMVLAMVVIIPTLFIFGALILLVSKMKKNNKIKNDMDYIDTGISEDNYYDPYDDHR